MAKREFNGVDIKVEFNETANRQQISSGDNINTLFGKIRKWLSDLKLVAFSGRYDDLEDKPVIPTKTSQLENDIGYKTTDTWKQNSALSEGYVSKEVDRLIKYGKRMLMEIQHGVMNLAGHHLALLQYSKAVV